MASGPGGWRVRRRAHVRTSVEARAQGERPDPARGGGVACGSHRAGRRGGGCCAPAPPWPGSAARGGPGAGPTTARSAAGKGGRRGPAPGRSTAASGWCPTRCTAAWRPPSGWSTPPRAWRSSERLVLAEQGSARLRGKRLPVRCYFDPRHGPSARTATGPRGVLARLHPVCRGARASGGEPDSLTVDRGAPGPTGGRLDLGGDVLRPARPRPVAPGRRSGPDDRGRLRDLGLRPADRRPEAPPARGLGGYDLWRDQSTPGPRPGRRPGTPRRRGALAAGDRRLRRRRRPRPGAAGARVPARGPGGGQRRTRPPRRVGGQQPGRGTPASGTPWASCSGWSTSRASTCSTSVPATGWSTTTSTSRCSATCPPTSTATRPGGWREIVTAVGRTRPGPASDWDYWGGPGGAVAAGALFASGAVAVILVLLGLARLAAGRRFRMVGMAMTGRIGTDEDLLATIWSALDATGVWVAPEVSAEIDPDELDRDPGRGRRLRAALPGRPAAQRRRRLRRRARRACSPSLHDRYDADGLYLAPHVLRRLRVAEPRRARVGHRPGRLGRPRRRPSTGTATRSGTSPTSAPTWRTSPG